MAEEIKEQKTEENVAEATKVVYAPQKLKEPVLVRGAWWLVENWRKALVVVGVGAVAFVAGSTTQNAGELAGRALGNAAGGTSQQLPASSSYGEEGPVEVPFAE